MATLISADPSVYFTNFATGNDFTPSTYFQYAADLDSNFVQLRTTVNQLVNEVQAVNGPSSLISQDMIRINDPDGPVGQVGIGVIGEHSYRVSINGGDNTLVDVQAGQALVTQSRVESISDVSISGAALGGAPVTAYVAIDTNGVPSVSATPNNEALDIASLSWNGSNFVAPITQLAEIFFDGDDYRTMRIRPANGGWSGLTYRAVGQRIVAIERALAGISTDSNGAAVSVLGIRGSAAAPGLVTSDGVTPSTVTGFFRQAANVLGFSASGVERIRYGSFGTRFNQDGSAGTPLISRVGTTNKGLYFTGTGVAISVGGAQQWEAVANQIRHPLGASASAPGISFIGDTDLGIFSPGANRGQLVSNGGNVGLEWTAEGHLDLPNNPRFRAENATESLASSSLVLSSVSFADADEVFDVGGWHSGTNADFTAPTGADGTYILTLAVTFDETGTGANTGQRAIAIQVNGNDKSIVQLEATSANETRLETSVTINVSAAQIVRARVAQNSGDTMNVTDIEWSAVKVA